MTTRQEREGNSKYQEQVLSQMLEEKYNKVCADCGTRGPTWVSINLGCFICIRCSGIHRKLGTHISKVRSVSLDKWSKEQVDSFKVLGNKVVNRYYEDRLPDDFIRQVNDDYQMEQFIRNKYEKKRWVGKSSSLQSSRDGEERPSRSEKSSPPPQKLLPASAPEFAPPKQQQQQQQYQQQQYQQQQQQPPQVATGSLLLQPHVSSAPQPQTHPSASLPSYLSTNIPTSSSSMSTSSNGGAGSAFGGASLGAGGSAPLSMDQLLSLYAPQPMAPQAVGSVPSHGTGYHGGPNYNIRLPTQQQQQQQQHLQQVGQQMPQYYAVPQQQQQQQYYGQQQPMMMHAVPMQHQQNTMYHHQQQQQQQPGLYYPQQQQQMPMYRPN